MRASYQFLLSLFVLLLSSSFQPLLAQLGFDLKIDKPQPYDNRILKAEKTGNKALKSSRKFLQNLTTHYNFFFNANNRLNAVINAAKQSFKDDSPASSTFTITLWKPLLKIPCSLIR